MSNARLPLNIDVEDYIRLKELYASFIQKIQPLAKVIDGETRKIIEDFNELYLKIEEELHSKIVLPSCFTPDCVKNICTSDFEICKYVQILIQQPTAIRVPNNNIALFEELGWQLVSKDIRDGSFFGSSDYSIMIPKNEED